MKISAIVFSLLSTSYVGCSGPAGKPHAISTYSIKDQNAQITPQNNYGGWVNPEDLPPMPQCIAQQDTSAWLEVMTRCVSRGCTRHFGIICTHHQWLARLDCLGTDFSPELVGKYLPLCSRSVLAKAQLYSWINSITGRTWLVEVGDSNDVHEIVPDSLQSGYMDLNILAKAPSCLRVSRSYGSAEAFQHIVSSCSFDGATKHTGNAARPWEYNEGLRSMIALDFETVGYDLTHHWIPDKEYIDKGCLCSSYTINTIEEPCTKSFQSLDLTKERLWMLSTCGYQSIPHGWASDLKTVGEAFVPVTAWSVQSAPTFITQHAELRTEQCSVTVCGIDEGGYCKPERAVEKVCFCQDMTYSLCGKDCESFEIRIAYIEWLHAVCSDAPGWRGLPKGWKKLAKPSLDDMIPWRWLIYLLAHQRPISFSTIILINLVAILLSSVSHLLRCRFLSQGLQLLPMPRCWFLKGLGIAGFYILANYINAFIVTAYSKVSIPIVELVMLWCSIPRPTWLALLPIGMQPLEHVDLSAAASALCAETILQIVSAYHLLTVIVYGVSHGFYTGRLIEVEHGGSAQLLYFGALMWLLVIGLTFLQISRIDTWHLRRWNRINWLPLCRDGGQVFWLEERFAWIDEQFAHYWMGRFKGTRLPILKARSRGSRSKYGTMTENSVDNQVNQVGTGGLYTLGVISTFYLWVSQCVFWAGMISLMTPKSMFWDYNVCMLTWIVSTSLTTLIGLSR